MVVRIAVRKRFIAFVALASLFFHGIAAAAPLPVDATTRVGRPARSVSLRIETVEGAVRLTARASGAPEVVTLPVAAANDASIEVVRLANDARIAVVRVRGAGGASAAALVTARGGSADVLWTGRLDAHGDRGERRSDVLEVADRTGDGAPDVIVGVAAEGTRICGQESTVLFPHAVDPATQRLRPVVLRRLPETAPAGEVEVRATSEGPGPEGAPVLDALRWSTASSASGAPSDPQLVPSPRGLGDRDAATAWIEGHGGDGRWEFATARWTGGAWPIRAFAITPVPSDAALAARVTPPRSLFLVGESGARLHVTLPDRAELEPGRPVWVVPAQPLSWQCVSVVLDEAAGGATAQTGIAEVAAYTDLDFGQGIDQLVAALADDGDRATEAARLLGSLGAAAVARTAQAWDDLTPLGRRRAVRVFADHARTDPAARAALMRGAGDPDAEVRVRAVEALVGAGDAARPALQELLRVPGDAGDLAALALAQRHPGEALPSILAGLEAEGGSERPVLRRALRVAVQRAEENVAAEALGAWSNTERSVAASAACAVALAPLPPVRQVAAKLVRGSFRRAERFEDEWRLVAAARELPSDPDVDPWLAQLAREADEWMLRAAAVEALVARQAGDAGEVARAALEDPYPRVRAAAVGALEGEADATYAIATRARRDPWPLVRARAVKALAPHPRARPVVRSALGDRAEQVRAAAIGALARARDRGAWPSIASRLTDDDEWPSVISAGVAFARELCVAEAREPLIAVLRRGIRPNAWAPDVDVAVEALGALVDLGGEAAREALTIAGRPSSPPQLRAAAQRARTAAPRCQGR